MVEDEPSTDAVQETVDAPPPPRPMPQRAPDGFGRAAAFFNTMDKCLRASKLYEGRGSLVGRLMADLLVNATHAIEGGELTVTVTPFGLMLGEEDVSPEDSRLTEVLFRMFCDGIRELSFSQGIDEAELLSFVDVLIADPVTGEDDFTTMLWKRNLAHVHFYATDTLQTGFDAGAGDDGLLVESERARLRSDVASAAEEVVLSPDDLRMLKAEDGLSWVRDCAAPMKVGAISQAMFDKVRASFQSPWDEGRFLQMAVRAAEEHPDEPSPLVIDMFDSLLSGGDIEGVARLLKAASEATKFGGAAAKNLQARLFDPERIAGLARIYERQVDLLFDAVRTGAEDYPDALVALLNGLAPGEARDGLRDALAEVGVDLTSFYAESLQDESEAIVLDAIASLRAIGTDVALQALGQALSYTSVQVRRKALEGLVGHYPDEARLALARSLGDPDRQNRMLTLRILRDSGDRRVAGKIMARVQDSSFASRDPEERALLVQALAAFHDPRTVPYFASVLSEVNLTRSADVQERQLLAISALSKMNAEPAREALEKCAKRWSAPKAVRAAAKRALARPSGEG